jgi:addiction module antidote protein HigA
MTKFSFNQAVPFEATHVGEVIKDELSARDMKQSELSGLTGIQRPILNDVIKGKRSLTPEMALLLEKGSIFLQHFSCRFRHNTNWTVQN